MARFEFEIDNEVMQQINKLEGSAEQMMEEMVQAGADVAENAVRANMPRAIKSSPMYSCFGHTRVYHTPSDDGINVKVGFWGYFTNENGKKTPAPLVANIFEYGRSNSPFPRQPFMRRSFSRPKIKAAMQSVQDRYIPK